MATPLSPDTPRVPSDREPAAGRRGRTGRRPGESRTREDIAAAAARQFAEQGYDRTSLRSVAQEAGVDAALVARFYGSKQELFASVVHMPFDPAHVIGQLSAGPPEGIGQRLATFLVGVLDSPQGKVTLTGLIRSASSEPEAARMIRDMITHDVLSPLAARLGADRPELRGALAASQLVGIIMARHVVGFAALAELPGDQLARIVAPTLQRYLVEPLDDD